MQEVNPWTPRTEEPLHSSTVEKSERQEQYQDLRCQSGPSAKNSVIFSGGDSSKNDEEEKAQQIAYFIYEYFRVTGVHDTVENYADLFIITQQDDFRDFDSKWDGILLSATTILPDDISERL